ASHGDSDCDCQATTLCQRNRVGNSTVWPRLDTGNSSVAPWRIPRTIAWNVEIRLDAASVSIEPDTVPVALVSIRRSGARVQVMVRSVRSASQYFPLWIRAF